jgi:SAM-dependent methyltransferase
MPTDPEEFRATARASWESSAASWVRARSWFQRDTALISRRLVELVEPEPGKTVLELAAGLGDTGFLALADLEPGGKLITTDGAEGMVAGARARAEELDVTELVEARVMEAEWIDLPTASVDGVLCRWGYMLLADPETALRETRRVLRPGGRVALACWDTPETNPWNMGRLLVQLGFAEPSDPDEPGPFSLADPGAIRELLESVGFVDDLTVEAVDFTFHAPSLDDWWEQQRDFSRSLGAVAGGLSPAEHTRLRDAVDEALGPHVRADGSVAVPARTLVAGATA